MMTVLIIAVAAQWGLLVLLALLNVALFRQVGLLHMRISPVGALTLPGGVAVGAAAPEMSLASLTGVVVQVGGRSDGRSQLIFFVSPTCPICKSLLPAIRAIQKSEGNRLQVVLASDGDEALQEKMIKMERLEAFPFVLSATLGQTLGVSKLPYAVLVGGDGKIAAKGLVNSREHLESLLEAERRGVASIQDFLVKRAAR